MARHLFQRRVFRNEEPRPYGRVSETANTRRHACVPLAVGLLQAAVNFPATFEPLTECSSHAVKPNFYGADRIAND
jgi:hypothetical protein